MDEKLNLDEIERVCELASPGPWFLDTKGLIASSGRYIAWPVRDVNDILSIGFSADDEDLLSNTPVWLPALVQELRELQDNDAALLKLEALHRKVESGKQAKLRARVDALEASLDSWKFGYTQAVSERSEEREKWIKCFARVEALEAALEELCDVIEGNHYIHDTFTTQPARILLEKYKKEKDD